jgi:hypothetical protein
VYDGLNSLHRHMHPRSLSLRRADGCDSIEIALRSHHIGLVLSMKSLFHSVAPVASTVRHMFVLPVNVHAPDICLGGSLTLR